MHLIYGLLLAFLSLAGELLCGSLGAAPPFLAITVFYLTKENSLSMGIFTAIFWGTVQDLALGRNFLFTPFKLLVLLALLLSINRKPCSKVTETVPAGLVTGSVITLANALCSALHGDIRPGGEVAAGLFFNSVLLTLWLPVQLLLFDIPAKKMKLNTFFKPEKVSGNRHRRVSSHQIHPGERR